MLIPVGETIGGVRVSLAFGELVGVEPAELAGTDWLDLTRRDVENCSRAVVRTQWFVYLLDNLAAANLRG